MDRSPLVLEVSGYTDADHWNWHLKDARGVTLASHAVILAHADWRREALFNLPAWLHYHCAPDAADEDERRHLQAFGAWLGEVVLGPAIAGHLVAYAKPAALVRLVLPQAAATLLALPLEMAHVSGQPLARYGVSFVFEVEREGLAQAPAVGESLRILALFSVPPAGSPLNLRGERQHLQSLVNRLAMQGRSIELRALQYGVTRKRLEQLLGDGGWDIVHFAGHGTSGALLLERPDGAPDPVAPDAIARLLSVAGARLKLVVLVACHSASASVGATLSWLGASGTAGEPDAGAQAAGRVEQGLAQMPAWVLERGLDCAVLATRYAVDDRYAMSFTNAFYQRLLEHGEPLPRAARTASEQALRALGRGGAAPDRPLSMTMPMLLGRRAADLAFAMPPRARPAARDAGPVVPPFAAEPRHFVGRVRAMTLASEALAENVASRGVLFHGMAGAGKTACVVELAWHHLRAARFEQVVWYRAPELNADASMTLSALALAMETRVPGIAMLHAVASESALARWLPVLRQTLETKAVLIVIDNVETLLTASGHWCDQRWSMLMRAFHDHGGASRVAMSSRLVPAGMPASFVMLTVHALPLDETLLLIRELPNLRALLEGRSPSVRAARGRELLRDTLRAVQGHPKLIEFAERLAADPERLARRLRDIGGLEHADADATDAYLLRGETHFDVQAFLDQLDRWTSALSRALSKSVRTVFHLLCALEPDDRCSAVVEANWQALWPETPHVDMRAAIARLESCGLLELRAAAGQHAQHVFALHPAVARAGRAEAGAPFQTRVDEVMVNYWYGLMRVTMDNAVRVPNAGATTARAGWSAFPYLGRNGEWEIASQMIERVMRVDDSPRATAMLLPIITRMAAVTAKTPKALITQSLLARVLNQAGLWREAVQRWEAVLDAAERAEDFTVAAPVCNDLANAWQSVNLEKAQAYAKLHHRYASLAGAGAWSELSALGQQLQMLSQKAQYSEVLSRLPELRRRMIAAGKPGPLEGMLDWNVRNVIFDTASDAAFQYGSACRAEAMALSGSQALAWLARARAAWRDSLKYNGKARAAHRRRGALPLELARSRLNDNGALIELERFSEAYAMLLECKAVFKSENAVTELGDLYSALGTLEQKRERCGPAREFEAKALRYKYQGGDARHVAISHFNLANRYLAGSPAGDRDFETGVAHRLAAAVIRAATDPDRAGYYAATLKAHIAKGGGQTCTVLSGDFDALCSIVEAIDGVAFRALMARLAPGREGALMKAIIATALEA
ncbi:CHAT domain-containing protein [Paraburkholderia sp. CNPSo 3272]|nr:CHAT domain-containing protein [Paraburkholderia sp. CNPSo 3272]